MSLGARWWELVHAHSAGRPWPTGDPLLADTPLRHKHQSSVRPRGVVVAPPRVALGGLSLLAPDRVSCRIVGDFRFRHSGACSPLPGQLARPRWFAECSPGSPSPEIRALRGDGCCAPDATSVAKAVSEDCPLELGGARRSSLRSRGLSWRCSACPQGERMSPANLLIAVRPRVRRSWFGPCLAARG